MTEALEHPSPQLKSLLAMVPPDMLPKAPQMPDPEAIERCERLVRVSTKMAIPKPSRSRPPMLSVERFTDRKYLADEDVKQAREILKSGPLDWDNIAFKKWNRELRFTGMQFGYVQLGLLAAAMEAGRAGNKKECAQDLALALQFANWATTRLDDNTGAIMPAAAADAVQVAVWEDFLDAEGCRKLLASLPKVTLRDRRLEEQVRSSVAGTLVQWAEWKPASPPCGKLDAKSSVPLLVKVKRIDLENTRRPLSKFDDSGMAIANALRKGLPEFPAMIPPDYETPDGKRKVADYCRAFDKELNGVGRQDIFPFFGRMGRLFPLIMSIEWRTRIELMRGGLAAKVFQSEKKRLPSGVDELTVAGYLDRPLLDSYVGQPLRYKDGVFASAGRDFDPNTGERRRLRESMPLRFMFAVVKPTNLSASP